jgi:Ca2+-binding RTX toxin-like protein
MTINSLTDVHALTPSTALLNQTLVVIDPRVASPSSLATGVLAGVSAIVLNPDEDGILQITEALQTRPQITELHLLSHGAPGVLYLGNTQLSLETLDRYAPLLQTWFSHPDSTLVLYGCQVAAGDAGEEFLTQLYTLTESNIAASTNLTGSTSLGGNWQLDARVGSPTVFLPFASTVLADYSGVFKKIIWTKGIGNSLDSEGNFYLTGNFDTGTTLSPGSNEIFVTKLNGNGKPLWNKSFIVTGANAFDCLTLDGSDNPYLIGSFNTTITFGNITLTSSGSDDIFVARFDKEGNVIWAKNFGSSGSEAASRLTSDNAGNLYLTGSFSNSISFGSTTLTSTGNEDIFVSKLDSSGNVVWAKSFGSSGADFTSSTNIDSTGNLYLTGGFSSSINFGSTTLTSAGSDDIFVSKLDSSGNVVWAKSFGGSGTDKAKTMLDKAGNLYLTGSFSNSISFGSTTLTSTGDTDAFITKLDSSGNVIWAKNFGGVSTEAVDRLLVDQSGNLYVIGSFSNSISFGSTTLTSTSSESTFVTKLDGSGNVVWAKGFGGANYQYARNFSLDRSGNLFLIGNFDGITATSIDYSNLFITKLDGSSGNTVWDRTFSGSEELSFVGVGIAVQAINFRGGKGKLGLKFKGTKDADVVVGSPFRDELVGGDGDDRLSPGYGKACFGNDRLFGGNGDDWLNGGNHNDLLEGEAGDDELLGGNGRDYLLGGEDSDKLIGDNGADILVGGAGKDMLTGGKGSDMFVCDAMSKDVDVITDFKAQNDLLDLREIFKQQAFSAEFSFVQYQRFIKLEQVGTSVAVKLDADGNGAATRFDTLVTLSKVSVSQLSVSNFVLG